MLGFMTMGVMMFPIQNCQGAKWLFMTEKIHWVGQTVCMLTYDGW